MDQWRIDIKAWNSFGGVSRSRQSDLTIEQAMAIAHAISKRPNLISFLVSKQKEE